MRARGNKTPDGAQMTADEIVSGQFKMIAGLVISVDPQENVIRINNIETKKPMTVKISADSSLKKLQPQLAQMIANRLHGVAPAERPAGGAPSRGRRALAAGRGNNGGGPPGGRGPAGGGRGDLQSMIDRTPAIKISDLMTGDAIIISSTNRRQCGSSYRHHFARRSRSDSHQAGHARNVSGRLEHGRRRRPGRLRQ